MHRCLFLLLSTTLFVTGVQAGPPALMNARDWSCLGDLDFDYDVDLADLQQLLANYGLTGGAVYEDGDLTGDGDVNLEDLQALLSYYGDTCTAGPNIVQLAGNPLGDFPFFEFVRAVNEDADAYAGIDVQRYPDLAGASGNLYVVHAKSAAEWLADPTLTDVRSYGPVKINVTGDSLRVNVFPLASAYELSGDAGTDLGVGYDVVLDLDADGLLDPEDYIDGMFGRYEEAGFYVVTDTTQDGPLAVTEVLYSGGTWLGQDLYYPTNIASLGELPLVVISHGNGHNYTWYDHLGYHLASWGCIVMSHENNTSPGIESASTTTLTNTDYIIGNQATINGGVLDGHLDSHRIVWIGHSRGAEGITRAYDRMLDGEYIPDNFTAGDILLLSSMLPTDFLKTDNSDPHAANYHLWTASADNDVDGSAGCDLCQTFHLHDRATRYRHSTVVQGAGHGDFHDGGGSSVADGPCLIGRANTHLIQQGYFLPLVKHYVEGNIPAHDFFWRQWESFKPIGAPTGTCIVVTNTYHNGAVSGNFVIDDFQSGSDENISSSGGAVSYTVENLYEGRLDDSNSSFSWSTSDPMNGMTHASSEASDDARGVVFDWDAENRYYELELLPGQQDLTQYEFVSLRACQGTRHPLTTIEVADLTFSLTLRDTLGQTSSIDIGVYGGGIEEPYQREYGWHNEFETIRVRLTDFLTDGTALDLASIAAVRLDFGPAYGSSEGRLGLDDIELTNDGAPNVFVNIAIVGGAPELFTPGVAAVLDVEIVSMGEEVVVGTPTVYYRYDGGTYISEPLTPLGGELYQVTLPAPVCGDEPEFYFSVEGTQSGVVTAPATAPSDVFAVPVGSRTVFFEETLDSDPGWTQESSWDWGQPTGQGGGWGDGGPDPTSGYTGNNVYGYNLDGNYENDLTTPRYLTSTAMDCTGRDVVILSFWRWLGVEQPLYDRASILVSTNGSTWQEVWTNPTEIADYEWVYQEFDISEIAANEPVVYIRWAMGETDGSWVYCGWNIDDVQLSTISCD